MTDKLTDFGHTFQIKSIACLITNQTFLEQIHDILDERNYLLMQLQKVDIPNHTKMKIQGAVNGDVPQLIKYKFQTMFLKDKLTSAIPNLDNWIMEFTRLDRFRGLNG